MLTKDTLLDAFIALFYDCKTISHPSTQIHSFLNKYKETILHYENKRQKLKDYDIVKVFATGSVGKVCLVKSKQDSHYYAMKILRKSDLLTKREAAFFMEEKESMIQGRNCEWLTRLYMSFQDEFNLYLLMEFVPGGSLKTLIDSTEEPMSERDALFYVSEMILAIHQVHSLGYIHRDVKPDNFLIQADGHLKITDFGSCIRISDTIDSSIVHETVGTPDYICPEILRAHEGPIRLDISCDWWSLGIVTFELLFDEVPFYAETLVETYARIMDHTKMHKISYPGALAKVIVVTLYSMITSQEKRLGRDGIQNIQSHPWFESISWNSMHEWNPPFIPDLQGPEDTKYFENEELDPDILKEKKLGKPKDFVGQHLPFIGYTFELNQESNDGFEMHSIQTPKMEPCIDSKLQGLNQESQTLVSLESLEKENSDLQNRIRQLELDLKMKDLELQSSFTEIQKCQKELSLIASNQDYESLLKEHQSLVSLSKEREQEFKRVHEQLQEFKKMELEFESRILMKNAQLEALSQQSDIDSKESKKLRQDIEVLQNELHELQHCYSQKETEFQLATTQIQKLQLDREDMVKEKTVENLKVKELQILNFTLEKSLASMDVKEQQNQEKAMALNQEIESLKSQLESFQTRDESKELITNLSNELDRIKLLKSKLEDQVHEYKQNQVQFEMDLVQLKESLDLEQREHSSTKESKWEMQTKLAETQQTLDFYSSKLEQLEMQLSTASNRIQSLKQCLKLENETVKNLDSKLKSQQDAFSQLQLSLDMVKAQLDTETMEKKKLSMQILSISQENQDLKTQLDSVLHQSSLHQNQRDAMYKENEILKQRMNIVMKQYDALLSEKSSLSSTSRQELEDLQLRYQQELQKRGNLETIKSKMTCLVMELEDAVKRETEKRVNLENLLESAHQKITSLESMFSEGPKTCRGGFRDVKEDHASKKRDSMDKMILLRQSKNSESSPDRQSLFSSTPRKSIKNSLLNLFKGQSFSIKGWDMEDDLGENHPSFESCNRSLISIPCDFDGVLRGWLKVPKGGKLRKGWIEKFFIIQNYQLLEFDKEKDVDTQPGRLIADLRSNIFVAKAVSPNEVIHVHSRDVFSIFKVQSSSVITNSFTSLDSLNSSSQSTFWKEENPKEIKKKMARLESELELEIRMQQAAEKILSVTKESQKHTVLGQLEAYSKRIESLQKDLQELSSHPSLSSLNDVQSTPQDGMQVNKETVDALKRELRQQMEMEYRKKDAIHRLEQAKSHKPLLGGSKSNHQTAYLDELHVIDRSINKLKDSEKSDEINKILLKYEYSMTHLGHQFKVKQFYTISDCSVCHETLWGNKNQGLECQVCKDICHKTCMQWIDTPCKDVMYLKSLPTMYFLTKDSQEKMKWIYGLNQFRKEAQEKSKI